MNAQERIMLDPKILVGKPVSKGTRLAVEFIIDLLAAAGPKPRVYKITLA